MKPLEHYIVLALISAGVRITPDMRSEIERIDRDIIDKAVVEAIQRVAGGEGHCPYHNNPDIWPDTGEQVRFPPLTPSETRRKKLWIHEPQYSLMQALGGYAQQWRDYPGQREQTVQLAIEQRQARVTLWEGQWPDPFAKLNADHERRALEFLKASQKAASPYRMEENTDG